PRPGATVQPVTDAGAVAPLPRPAGAAGAVPVVYADPALEDARPLLRPEGLVPPETAAPDGAADLADAPAGRLTSPKPRARPPGLLAAEAAPQAGTAAAQAAGASLVATAGEGAASPLAIAVSRKPAARPAQASAAGEAAVSVAAADASLVPDTGTLAPAVPAPEPQPVPAARPAEDDPEAAEIDEPEIASAAPSVPTRASVAKQATYRNSINLSKINLIGVYGSSSNRYAMVRQANGRFVRVAVGDRVDGGRVAAISERELHYVKNGTTHKLAMPNG
ncbi:MAG: translation initiation factor 2, partial [Rhodobacterales bacterium]